MWSLKIGSKGSANIEQKPIWLYSPCDHDLQSSDKNRRDHQLPIIFEDSGRQSKNYLSWGTLKVILQTGIKVITASDFLKQTLFSVCKKSNLKLVYTCSEFKCMHKYYSWHLKINLIFLFFYQIKTDLDLLTPLFNSYILVFSFINN